MGGQTISQEYVTSTVVDPADEGTWKKKLSEEVSEALGFLAGHSDAQIKREQERNRMKKYVCVENF